MHDVVLPADPLLDTGDQWQTPINTTHVDGPGTGCTLGPGVSVATDCEGIEPRPLDPASPCKLGPGEAKQDPAAGNSSATGSLAAFG